MEKKTINKIIKILGNVVMIIAIVFIVRRLLKYNIDYSILVKGNNLLIFKALVFAYAISVILCSIPWKNAVYLMTGEKLRFVDVAAVSTKANVLKYIPGNIFQYIGRNALAVKNGLKHADVALSTLIDVVINLGTVFILTLVFAYDTVKDWILQRVRVQYVVLFLIIITVIVIFVVVALYKKRDKYKDTLKRVFSKNGIGIILLNILLYIALSLYTTVIYIIAMSVILGGSFDVNRLYYVAGAVLASWMLGFITPGAPGGMGIRETVLLMLLGGIMKEEVILLSVVVNRVISILGDVLALAVMQVVVKVWRTQNNE